MKKTVLTVLLLGSLAGCDEANKVISQAQDAAQQVIDEAKKRIGDLDLSEFNLEQFGGAMDSAKTLTESIKDSLNIDMNNRNDFEQAQDQIANAYNCLVDASSESTADKIINKIMETIGEKEHQSLVEKSIERAKAMKECVI